MITQINDRDRQHLRTFSAHRKAEVMKKIMSSAPVQNVVYHGKNRFEKAMMEIHREGYGLIDMQPQENAFTTVWYRKGRKFTGKNVDVTMLLWEEGEQGDTTTVVCWKF